MGAGRSIGIEDQMRVRPFWKVGDVIAAFVRLGCEVRHTSSVSFIDGTTGDPVTSIRFLHNPKTRGFVPISDLNDDERIPPSEVANWERRLGVGPIKID